MKFTEIQKKCTSCDICVKECLFLQQYGNPKKIAAAYNADPQKIQEMGYECSLCGLCTAVCPMGLDPVEIFLEMRQNTALDNSQKSRYKRLLNYEKRGTSNRFGFYGIPENCDTVFFPGCTLPGTRPKTTWKLIDLLKSQIPNLGIVLDCCSKPSHDLGETANFRRMFDELRGILIQNKIKTILVACPNCYKIFQWYGSPMRVQTVYEYLFQNHLGSFPSNLDRTLTLHDPCPMRFETDVLSAVRNLLNASGCRIEEMPHTGRTTLCCGEGGAVGLVTTKLASHWRHMRNGEINGAPLITYCAGCAQFLSQSFPTHHILDFFFEPEKTLAGKTRVSTAPFTYLNRLRLKQKLKKTISAKTGRERTHHALIE